MTLSEEKDSIVIVSVADVCIQNKELSLLSPYGLQIPFPNGNIHCTMLKIVFLILKNNPSMPFLDPRQYT